MKRTSVRPSPFGSWKLLAGTPASVLATLYRFLGIDPKCTTLPDFTGRPVYLLDEPEPISELG